MKLSTAVKKAAKNHTLAALGDQWQVMHKHSGYTTSSSPTSYSQAVQWRKESVAEEALVMMGVDEELAGIVSFVSPYGTALELAERAMDKMKEMV